MPTTECRKNCSAARNQRNFGFPNRTSKFLTARGIRFGNSVTDAFVDITLCRQVWRCGLLHSTALHSGFISLIALNVTPLDLSCSDPSLLLPPRSEPSLLPPPRSEPSFASHLLAPSPLCFPPCSSVVIFTSEWDGK